MRADEVASGQVAWAIASDTHRMGDDPILMPSYAPGLGAPGHPFGLFMTGFENCRPRTLTLEATRAQGAGDATDPFATQGEDALFQAPPFPPRASGGAYHAGLMDLRARNRIAVPKSDSLIAMHAACSLRYGQGNTTNHVVFDWVPGTYQLPPVSYVDCGLILWGYPEGTKDYSSLNIWHGNNPYWYPGWNWRSLVGTRFAASCAPGELTGAHVPTASDAFVFVENEPRTFYPPAGARAVECLPETGAILMEGVDQEWSEVFAPRTWEEVSNPSDVPVSYGQCTRSRGPRALRDFNNGDWRPPWSPVPINPSANLRIHNISGGVLIASVTFYLQL